MTSINQELYQVLIDLGARLEAASKASAGIVDEPWAQAHLATTRDLAELRSELRVELSHAIEIQTRFFVSAMIALTGIFAAIVKLF